MFDETQIRYLVERDFSDSDIAGDPYQPVFQEEELNISKLSEYFNNGVELENLNVSKNVF